MSLSSDIESFRDVSSGRINSAPGGCSSPILQEIRPYIVPLEAEVSEEVADLEQRCYPCPWSRPLVLGEFGKDISYRLGLKLHGRIIGYSFCYLIPGDLHLLNIAIAPEHRGRGFGRYLLCSLLSRAMLRGARNVSLEVRPSNRSARTLYQDLEFKVVGLRRKYYQNNGEDALLLERAIAPGDLRFFERSSRFLKNSQGTRSIV